jgi:hypothetical protein
MRRLALLPVLTLALAVPLLLPERATAQLLNRRLAPLPPGGSAQYYARTSPAEYLMRAQFYYALQVAEGEQLDQLIVIAAERVGRFGSQELRTQVIDEMKTLLRNPQTRARAAYDLTFNGFALPTQVGIMMTLYPGVGSKAHHPFQAQLQAPNPTMYTCQVLQLNTRPFKSFVTAAEISAYYNYMVQFGQSAVAQPVAFNRTTTFTGTTPLLASSGGFLLMLDQNPNYVNPLKVQEQLLLQQQLLLLRQMSLKFFVTALTRSDDELRQMLQDPQPMARLLAIQMIALKNAPLEKDLIPLVADEQPLVGQAARALLVQVNQGIDHGPGFPATRDECQKARQKWQEWLTRRDGPAVKEATLVRQVLERLPPEYQDLYLAVLREDKTDALPLALAVAIPEMDAALQDKTRLTLAQQLTAARGDKLPEALKDRNPEFRAAAATALGQSKKKMHAPALVGVLEDEEHPRVVEAARRALQALTGQDFGPQPRATLAQRTAAVKAWRGWLAQQAVQ